MSQRIVPGTDSIYLDDDGNLIAQNVDFQMFKAIRMVCDSGTNFPASPLSGQWYYRTDISTLFIRQTSWRSMISFGAVTLYVDPTGTNDPDYGYAPGTDACLTIQYAINRIPAINGGNVIVNVAAGTYNENVIIQGKSTSGNFSITLNGVLTAVDTGTCSVDGVKGIDGTQGTLTDTGNLDVAHAGKLLYEASDGANGYRIIDSCTANTATIVGTFASKPLSGETYYVYSWGTIITGSSTSLIIRNQIMPVYLNRMSFQEVTLSNNVDAGMTQCSMEYLFVDRQAVMSLDTCICSSSSHGTLAETYTHSLLSAYKSKFYQANATPGWVVRSGSLSKVTIANGCVIDGSVDGGGAPVSTFGFIADLNSAGQTYSTSADGYNIVRNCAYGIYSTSGSQIHGADVANCTFTNNTADVTDEPTAFAYAG